MMRTAVNVFSDSCGAVIIGRLQGEQGILEDLPALKPPGAAGHKAVKGRLV